MSSPLLAPERPPAQQSQAAQAGLALLVTAAIAKLWPSLDLLHLRQSLPAFKAAVAQEVQRHAQASATLAARQYRQQRVAAGAGAGFTPRPADPPSLQQVAQAVDWAVQPLWDTAVPVASFPDAPAETQKVASTAIADAKARLAASGERLVLDTGQATIKDNSQRDRKAKGWARVPEPGACYFCALLAARGAVYKDHAFVRSDEKFVAHIDVPSTVKVHDHCRCHVEPVFTAYEPSAQIREWQKLYTDVTADYSGADKLIAFRQAFEGREVKVTDRKTGAKKAPTPARKRGERTQDEIRTELTALEKNVPNLKTDQQREWTGNRIAALKKLLGE